MSVFIVIEFISFIFLFSNVKLHYFVLFHELFLGLSKPKVVCFYKIAQVRFYVFS